MLASLPYARLPFGAVRPRGWLAAELARLASGLTGRLMDVWPDVGPTSGWLGGDGEAWERGPYYARGLVALAHTLGDATLAARARSWLDWSLASQGDDGAFGPVANPDWWARMPMIDALVFHHEATGDPRVVPFLARYLRHLHTALPSRPLEAWARARGAEAMQHALWLYERTGEPELLALVDRLRGQTADWLTELSGAAPSDAFELAHGVNRAMGLRLPGVLARRTGDRRLLAVVRGGWERTLASHGQVHGAFSCDEMLHGTSPAQGTELCTVVELLQTMLGAFAADGGAWAADALERLAYNALPAMLGPDGCTRQYFMLANQVACTPGAHRFWYHHDTDLLFGLETGYGCCTANLHLGWPTVVQSLWLASRDGGIVAPLFGPCEVRASVAGGARVHVVEETDHPFEDRVRMAIGLDRAATFTLTLRIPPWTARAVVAVNDAIAWEGPGGILVPLRRDWRDGDLVDVLLPADPRTTVWDGGIAVERGPLVYVLPVGEAWSRVAGTPPFADYALHPTTPWAIGIGRHGRWDADGQPVGTRPWSAVGAPVRLHGRGYRVGGWDLEAGSAAPPPASFVAGAAEPIALVPFGSARLRIAVFPVAG